MRRFKLTLEYDGRPFVGWQRQDNGLSIQEVVEVAAERYCGVPSTVLAAGRTDAGVHAQGQVVHLDIARDDPPETVLQALNFHLKPHPVAVLSAELAPEGFHARFSAVERSYLYRILNRRARPALDVGRVWWVPMPLDEAAMAAAGEALIGRHDFSSFRAAGCQADSPVKTMDEVRIWRRGPEIRLFLRARSFLHNQVRIITGTLKLVGDGSWAPERMAEVLAARDRAAAGPTAPPDGLALMGVRYDPAAPPLRPPAWEL